MREFGCTFEIIFFFLNLVDGTLGRAEWLEGKGEGHGIINDGGM